MTLAAGTQVAFDSDGCHLAGTFIDAPNPMAATLVIPGSGLVDRDSNTRQFVSPDGSARSNFAASRRPFSFFSSTH
jgi:hypothetical protein